MFCLEYRTIKHEVTIRKVISRSIFIASACEVADEASTREFLVRNKETNPQADHYCYAYRLGHGDREVSHYSDGGEPNGTAGRPIQGALLSAGVTNAMIVITRYFGGKKLGIPGLIVAYRDAATAALAEAGVTIRVPRHEMRLTLTYGQLEPVRRLIRAHGGKESESNFGSWVELRCQIPEINALAFLEDLRGFGVTIDRF